MKSPKSSSWSHFFRVEAVKQRHDLALPLQRGIPGQMQVCHAHRLPLAGDGGVDRAGPGIEHPAVRQRKTGEHGKPFFLPGVSRKMHMGIAQLPGQRLHRRGARNLLEAQHVRPTRDSTCRCQEARRGMPCSLFHRL